MQKILHRSLNFFIAYRTHICFLGGGIIAAFLVIYLTPLKHLNLIEPRIYDIPATEFYTQLKADPERYIFIDVRTQAKYDAGHAEGSINIPLPDMYSQHHSLPKHGKTIVLICGRGAASGVAYGYLEHYGFLNIRRIEGGVEAWQTEGLPITVSATQ